MKVLHLPTDVGGNAYGLSRGERELGLVSDVLYRSSSWLNYPADIALSNRSSKASKLFAAVSAAVRIPRKYNILHFNFGCSLIDFPVQGINHWDLPLYKKQKLFVTYNGSDARMTFETMYPGKEKHPDYAGIHDPLYADAKQESIIKTRIKNFEKAGARFFALNPDLVRCLPEGAEFLPYAVAGAVETMAYTPASGKLKIVHAPTDRIIKGTWHILPALNELKKRYPDRFEVQLVEGMDNKSALQLYKSADIIIDQLRAGWYGGFAVEAMKMGKPVVVYLNHEDMRFIPVQMAKDCKEALIEADIDTIGHVLECCLHDEKLLRQKSAAGIEYVHTWHDPVKVARRVKTAYEED